MELDENIAYMGWPNCLRLSNGELEVVIASDIGLRILRFGFVGEQNLFYLSPEDLGKQGGDTWRIFGGHRLWHAPEALPRSYAPDNDPITFEFDRETLKITQPREPLTGIIKEMEIGLSPHANQLTMLHRLINTNCWELKLSAWAISALAPGGQAIVPQEPFGEGEAFLLPARSLALWSYTTMTDPRWTWGDSHILAGQDPSMATEQKIGIMNRQGWAAYRLKEDLLIKLFGFDPAAEYPDFGSNNEIYINKEFLELETLSPYASIPPLGKIEHIEYWTLLKTPPGNNTREYIDQEIVPRVSLFQNELLPEVK
jgi:hypothetical protein